MRKIFLLCIMMMTMGFIHAGVLIEPFAGITIQGNAKPDDSAYSGQVMGARLGYTNLGLMLGLDYRQANITVEQTTGDIDFSHSIYNFFIGYQLPVMLRFWYAHTIGGEGSVDSMNAKYSEPSGSVIGVGFTGLPFLSLNLEVSNFAFGKVDVSGVSADSQLEGQHYLLSVSFPLSL